MTDVIIRGPGAIAACLAAQARRLGATPQIARPGGRRQAVDLGLVLTSDWASAPRRNQAIVMAWQRAMRALVGTEPARIVPVQARTSEAEVFAESIGGIIDMRALARAAHHASGGRSGRRPAAKGAPVIDISMAGVPLYAVADAAAFDAAQVTALGSRETPPWTWIYAAPWQGRIWTNANGASGASVIGAIPERPPTLRIVLAGPRTISLRLSGNDLILLPDMMTIIERAVGAPWLTWQEEHPWDEEL